LAWRTPAAGCDCIRRGDARADAMADGITTAGFTVPLSVRRRSQAVDLEAASAHRQLVRNRAGAIDYLLKPVGHERLAEAVDRARQLSAREAAERVAQLQDGRARRPTHAEDRGPGWRTLQERLSPLYGAQREFCSRCASSGGGLQSDSEQKSGQVIGDALIEPVEFAALVTGEFVIAGKGF
jgi:hypothetical protein